MKIKTRLTIWFTILVASILFVILGVLYWSSSKNRESEFFRELQREAITKANLFLETKISPQTLHKIYQNNSQILNEVEVAVYSTDFILLYHDAVEIDRVKETREMINHIIKKGIYHFYQDDWQGVGILYRFNNVDYVVTAIAYDEYGYSKQSNLLKTIIALSFVSILVIFFVGRLFSSRALDPVKKMIEEVNKITAINLDLRLKPQKNNDELNDLASTFNKMLNRLENSFDSQKQFVSNISHELRTPLAAIIAELDLALNKEKNKEEYIKTIENALSDARKLVKLSNSLLDFAKASYDPSEIVFKPTRIDEVLIDACQQLQRSDPNYKFNINIDEDLDSEKMISVIGNSYLLQVAFINLLENACKFSDNNQCNVSISNSENKIKIEFRDTGIGISPVDIDHIFVPFYRGENRNFSGGNGIGLPLTKKIILLHHGEIKVHSKENSGTVFTVEIPLLS